MRAGDPRYTTPAWSNETISISTKGSRHTLAAGSARCARPHLTSALDTTGAAKSSVNTDGSDACQYTLARSSAPSWFTATSRQPTPAPSGTTHSSVPLPTLPSVTGHLRRLGDAGNHGGPGVAAAPRTSHRETGRGAARLDTRTYTAWMEGGRNRTVAAGEGEDTLPDAAVTSTGECAATPRGASQTTASLVHVGHTRRVGPTRTCPGVKPKSVPEMDRGRAWDVGTGARTLGATAVISGGSYRHAPPVKVDGTPPTVTVMSSRSPEPKEGGAAHLQAKGGGVDFRGRRGI